MPEFPVIGQQGDPVEEFICGSIILRIYPEILLTLPAGYFRFIRKHSPDEFEFDRRSDCTVDLIKYHGMDIKFFDEFPVKSLRRCLTGIDLAAWKLQPVRRFVFRTGGKQ